MVDCNPGGKYSQGQMKDASLKDGDQEVGEPNTVVAWLLLAFAQKNRLFGKKASPLDVSYVAIL